MQIFEFAPAAVQRYSDARLEVDFRAKSVTLDLEPVRLTRMEYDLLAFLAQHAGDVIARDELLAVVWGYGAAVHTRTVDVHIRRVRRKLGGFGSRHIETVFRAGYRLQRCHDNCGISNLAAG